MTGTHLSTAPSPMDRRLTSVPISLRSPGISNCAIGWSREGRRSIRR